MKDKIRNDWKLIGGFLLVCLLLSVGIRFFFSGGGAMAIVSVDGEMTARYDLYQEQTIVIEGAGGFTNTLVIKDGEADITDAGCPDKLCVFQKGIHRAGESIICLPNRVVVEISGESEREVDAVAD